MTGKLIAPLPAEIEGRSQAAGSKWRPFPKYKDSDVEWLGDIPEHWEVRRLKQICKLAYGDALAVDVRKQGSIPVYGSNGRVGFHSSANTKAPCLIVGRKGSFGKVNFSAEPVFAIDTTFFIDNRFSTADIRWLFYLLGWLRLDEISKDSAIPGLDREDAYQLSAVLPSTSEQHAIAAFLDRETAKIDDLIEKKRRLISLLEEKRAAIISHAVTKGLNPDAPMKDSGVEWLGEIPVGWDVCRLKFAAKLESGHTPSRTVPEYWENCTIPWVTLNDVSYLKNHEYISETENYINKLGLANSSARILPQDTVILSRDATVGRCGILGRPMATSQHFIDWICSEKLNPRYLLMLFREPMQQEFDRLTMGATIRTIGMPEVNSFTVPLPPIYEQNLIVTFVDREIPNIDKLLLKIDEAINKLQEYRSALISAAVTGKIDVREASL